MNVGVVEDQRLVVKDVDEIVAQNTEVGQGRKQKENRQRPLPGNKESGTLWNVRSLRYGPSDFSFNPVCSSASLALNNATRTPDFLKGRVPSS